MCRKLEKKVSEVNSCTTLKAAREQSGKTQLQVAKETLLNIRMYQRYESGMSAKTIQTAIRIAKTLGSTVENLWGEKAQALKP